MAKLSIFCVLPILLAGVIAMIVVHLQRRDAWWLPALWGSTILCGFSGVLAAADGGSALMVLVGLALAALTTVALVFEIRSIRRTREEEPAEGDLSPASET